MKSNIIVWSGAALGFGLGYLVSRLGTVYLPLFAVFKTRLGKVPSLTARTEPNRSERLGTARNSYLVHTTPASI